MADDYEIDGEIIAEKDGSGNLVIKNIDEATISKLAAALNANGQDISSVGSLDAESVQSGGVGIGNTAIEAQTVTVSDDSVAEFNAAGEVIIFVMAEERATASFVSAFGSLSPMALSGRARNQNNTDLQGTTGTDGVANYSRDGNTFHIENRLGQEVKFDLLFFNA